jgi:predicted MFS family arabinose efflux permease
MPSAAPAARLTRARLLLLAGLCAVSVANIYYAQPLLERIGAGLSIPAGQLGWVVAVGQAGYLVGLAALVPLGDWVSRRKLIAAQLVLAGAGTAVAATSAGPAGLFAGIGIAGVFSVAVQVAVAYTAALSSPGERGRNIGFVTSGVVIGIIMARTMAGLVAELAGWRAVYLASALASAAMAVLAWLLLPDDRRRERPRSYGAAVASVAILTATNRVFRTRAAIAFFLFASFGVLWSGLALPLSHAPWHLSTAQIGLFGFAGLAGTLGAARAGRWADRGRAAPVTVLALAVLIASWWFTGQAGHSLWLAAAGAVLLDFAVQAVHVTSQNLIVAETPESSSRIIASYMICYSLGSALGAVTTAALYERAGWPASATLGACYAAAALAVWIVDRVIPELPGRGRESRCSRRFRAAGSAGRPGSAGWRPAPRPRPAGRIRGRSPRRASSGRRPL